MAELCRVYWYPLYAFIRRQGHDAHEAEDLTQEFFAQLLAKDYLEHVDPAKGRFRSFLLTAVKHFLANQWDRGRALKRGGGQTIVPLDGLCREDRYNAEPAHDVTPEKLYERNGAGSPGACAGPASGALRGGGQGGAVRGVQRVPHGRPVAADLRPGRGGAGDERGGGQGGRSPAATPLPQPMRQEIAETVAGPEEIDEEIRYLLSRLL